MDDPTYRRLFAFPRMVEDLLRAVVRGDWIDEVDFRTLRKLPADHVGDQGMQRRGDAAWKVRFHGRWLHLLVVLEFQSASDQVMALRIMEYTMLLYRELDRQNELPRPGQWPAVLPVILYSGDDPWTAPLEMRDLIGAAPPELERCQPSQRALLLDEQRVAVDDLPLRNLMRAVVALEQSGSPSDLVAVVDSLREWLASPSDTALGRAFASGLRQVAAQVQLGGAAALPRTGTLEETRMSLLERVAEWPKEWLEEGRREGVVQGRREGVVQGRREGVVHEHALLARQAALRFGDEFGQRVEALLETIDDTDTLTAAAELVVGASSGAALVEGLSDLRRESR